MSKRFLTISVVFVCGITEASSQTLTAKDGQMIYLSAGYTYTLQPFPSSDSSISPIINGYEFGEPMTFYLNSRPGAEFKISFTLTGEPVGYCHQPSPFSFSTNGLRWEEKNERLDPNTDQTISIDSSGKATVDLGIRIAVPSGDGGGEIQAFVKYLVIDLQTGDSLSASATFYAEVFADLPLDDVAGEMKNLSRGYTYSLTPRTDASAIAPLINGLEQGTVTQVRINAPRGDNVLLGFTLPTYLIGDEDEGQKRWEYVHLYEPPVRSGKLLGRIVGRFR